MYEEKKNETENWLTVSQELQNHHEKLKCFNTKLDELHNRILSNDFLSIENVDDVKESTVYDKWKQLVNIAELKSETSEILNQLECSISL